MSEALLPLFPLQLVLFPGTPLPLHIFEDRYKEMIGEAIRTQSEFGVVQAGQKGIANTGCTATIERVLKRHDDGRLDILTLGRRRFEILLLNEERSFLRGSVEFYDDDDLSPAPDDLKRKALEGFAALRALGETHVFGDPELEDPRLSFQLAQLVDDLSFRQSLLALRSESERIKQLAEYLPGYATRRQYMSHMKSVASSNGHGKTSHS
jgi:Lon protease-like protein